MHYLFQRSSDGVWIFGSDESSICRTGIYRLNTNNNQVIIRAIFNRDLPVEFPSTFADYFKENRQPYSSMAEFKNATTGFFADNCIKAELIDASGNPSGKPTIVDTTSETIIYEGYKSGSSYRICKLDASTAILSRTWATGAWDDRATLNYE